MSIARTVLGGEDLLRRISKAIAVGQHAVLNPYSFNQVELGADEVDILLAFRRRYVDPNTQGPGFPMAEMNRTFFMHDAWIADTLFELVTGRVDLTTPRGRDAEKARRQLGLRAEVDVEVRDGLIAAYGDQYLDGASVFGRLHATAQTLGLFPILEQLGLKSLAYVPSDYSGDLGVVNLVNVMLLNRMARAEQLNPGLRAMELLIKTEADPVILINGGRFFAAGVPEQLKPRIANGQLRFIQHNAADENANKKLPPGAIIIDLANSFAKKLEAQVIGEQCALHCSQAAIDHLYCALRESHVIVKGSGLIGGSGVEGLLAFGYAPDKITVIDTNPEVLTWARSIGIENAYPTEPDYLADMPNAVMLVATRGMGLTGEHYEKLPRHTVVLTMTTDGGGVDVKSFQNFLPDNSRTKIIFGAHGTGLTERNVFADLSLSNRVVMPPGEERTVTFVNCRHDNQETWNVYPKNLVLTVGQLALVTSPMLAIAVCEAKAQTKPGVHPITPAGITLLKDAVDRVKGDGPLIKKFLPPWFAKAVDGLECRVPPRFASSDFFDNFIKRPSSRP